MNTASFGNPIMNRTGTLLVGARLFGVIFILSVLWGTGFGAEIRTSQLSYGPNADIVVTYSGAPGNAQDWIAFYDAGAPDGNYRTYQYLNGSQNGTLVFTSPEVAGDYDFRMFENNGYTLLATSPTITVSFPAEIDTAFGPSGTYGWIKMDFLGNGKSDWICAISVLENDKILVAGTAKTGLTAPNGSERNEIALARFTADGELDGTFGEGGKVHTELTNTYPIPLSYLKTSAMVVQPDGKIIVGGSTDYDFLLVRYTADGLIDETFGQSGIAIIDMRYSEADAVKWDELRCLVLQEDGKIIAGGASLIDAPYSPGALAIARLNPDGSIDNSFNGLGKLSTSYQSITGHFRWAVNSLALDPDGRILAGITAIGQFGGNQTAIARYEQDATLDSTFGTDGIAFETRPGSYNSQMTAITLTPSGRILALGNDLYTVFLMRYWSEGFTDSTFGTDGQTVSNLSPDGDVPAGIILLPRNMILLGASFDTYYGLSVMGTFGLARYDSAGRLDPGFGNVRFP